MLICYGKFIFLWNLTTRKSSIRCLWTLLEGKRDVLKESCISEIKIKDKSVIKLSGKEIHPIIIFTRQS